MMETSSTLNQNKNMSDPYTNSNSPHLSMTNLPTQFKIKTRLSKSYRNPKKSSINTNASSSINRHLHNHSKKLKHLNSLLILTYFHYTLLNSQYTKSTITNRSQNIKTHNTFLALFFITMSSSQTKKLNQITSQILSKISTILMPKKSCLKINLPLLVP